MHIHHQVHRQRNRFCENFHIPSRRWRAQSLQTAMSPPTPPRSGVLFRAGAVTAAFCQTLLSSAATALRDHSVLFLSPRRDNATCSAPRRSLGPADADEHHPEDLASASPSWRSRSRLLGANDANQSSPSQTPPPRIGPRIAPLPRIAPRIVPGFPCGPPVSFHRHGTCSFFPNRMFNFP